MRKLVTALVILAALWCGWWWIASAAMDRAARAQFDVMRKQGWDIAAAETVKSGFPFAFERQLTGIRLTDPDDITYDIPDLRIAAKAYWPGHAMVFFPSEPMTVSQAGRPFMFAQTTDAVASLRLRPGPALQLQNANISSAAWLINTPSGNLISAQDMSLDLTQSADINEEYRFEITASDLSPGDLIRAAMRTPAEAPLTFDAYDATGTIRFDAPLSRYLLTDTRPQPRALQITQAQITWGPLGLSSTADLRVDAAGTPDGEMTVKADNWRQMLDYGQRAGAISAQQVQQATLMLSIFANMSGTPDDISVTLRAQEGQLNVNGIGVGPAPKIRWQ